MPAARNPAAGGGRWVDVPPERFVRWMAMFAQRHGGLATRSEAVGMVTFRAADGATAQCHLPFGRDERDPPLTPEAIAAHAGAERTVGVLLVRLGGYAVGVFQASPPRLVASKTGSRLVHGRSAAGGWSQHRFARRRENQAATALRAAADAAAAVFAEYPPDALDAVVLGGDKRSIAALQADPRLAPYLTRATPRFLTVPDPRLPILQQTPRTYRSIHIRLTDPPRHFPGPE